MLQETIRASAPPSPGKLETVVLASTARCGTVRSATIKTVSMRRECQVYFSWEVSRARWMHGEGVPWFLAKTLSNTDTEAVC